MPESVAYPGVPGSFSWEAARQLFSGKTLTGFGTFEQAARAVALGETDYGVLPVENSFAGVVLATYTLLERLPLFIVGEALLPVRHMLLGVKGATLEGLRSISSHPQAIAQCDSFLAGLKGVRLLPSANTAISARDVAEAGDPACGAIASAAAAELYGLQVLRSGIQTVQSNTTRFLVVSRREEPLGQPDKATVVFRVRHEVGALVRVLSSFAESGLNMTHIESRPLPQTPFEYFFSADFVGQMDSRSLRSAMDRAREHCLELRIMGIYPQARLKGTEEKSS